MNFLEEKICFGEKYLGFREDIVLFLITQFATALLQIVEVPFTDQETTVLTSPQLNGMQPAHLLKPSTGVFSATASEESDFPQGGVHMRDGRQMEARVTIFVPNDYPTSNWTCKFMFVMELQGKNPTLVEKVVGRRKMNYAWPQSFSCKLLHLMPCSTEAA